MRKHIKMQALILAVVLLVGAVLYDFYIKQITSTPPLFREAMATMSSPTIWSRYLFW